MLKFACIESMFRILVQTLLLIFLWNFSKAEDFAFLSRNYPVKASFKAESKTILDVKFKLNSSKSRKRNLYLRAIYIIGNDTITDYLHYTANFEGIVKQIPLNVGETVEYYLYLNNEETEEVKNLVGSINLIPDGILPPNNKFNRNLFPGTVWSAEDPVLFKITKQEETKKELRINFVFTENFEFDRLFIRIKVISPEQGIVVLNKEIEVNTSDFLEFSKNTIKTEIPEVLVKGQGTYYIQITHQMQNLRVNGIDNAAFELLDPPK